MKKLMIAACAAMAMGAAGAASVNWEITTAGGDPFAFTEKVSAEGTVAGRYFVCTVLSSDTIEVKMAWDRGECDYGFAVYDGKGGIVDLPVRGEFGTEAEPVVFDNAEHDLRVAFWTGSSIPEPTAAWLALVASACLALRRRG